MEKRIINGNEPAMPLISMGGAIQDGLTIRQHFAAMAMQGLLASWGNHDLTDLREIAHDAVASADALIDELNK